MSDRTPAYYLAYDDPISWDAFLDDSGRSTFGFTEVRKTAIDKILPGDLLLCYLKGSSRWSGVLRVVPDGPRDTTPQDRRDRYPVRRFVERVLTLPSYKSVSIHEPDVWRGLSCTRDLPPKSQGWIAKAGLRNDLAQLSVEDGRFLIRVMAHRAEAPLLADAASQAGYDPQDEVDARERTERQIVARRGQDTFRRELISAYQGRCAISACDVPDVLEAAHVTPYLGPRSNHVTNGLLLRADLHTLWDCGLLMADPTTRNVAVHSRLAGTEYASLEGQALREPTPSNSAPSQAALRQHLEFARDPVPKATAGRQHTSDLASKNSPFSINQHRHDQEDER